MAPLDHSDEADLEIAHVLFMDIVGYSKLLVDEQAGCTVRLNRIVRSSPHFRAAEAADKLVRLPTGDGMVLVFFTSPESPVRCAMEIASALQDCQDFALRMGVHSGPVNMISDVNDRSNVAGSGINIAQRIMDCGDGGHILLSQRVAEDLAQYGRWKPLLHDLGEAEVKHGVKVSVVNLFSDLLGNPALPQKFVRAKSQPKAQRVRSLAVKPLDNYSEDAGKGYFADGMTDELITKLSQIGALERVISRSTMMKYKQSSKTVPEIAEELKVEAVLEGSVMVSGDRVRISAQLIEAGTDQTLWTDSYTRSFSDILMLQNEVALAIAEAIQLKLTPAEQERLSTAEKVNPKAYDYYLRGKNAYGLDKNETEVRINMLEKSIFIDDNFAEAHADLSIAYSSKAYFLEAGGKQWEIKAELAAEKALELKPDLPAALLAQARLQWRPTSGFQHEQAILLTQRALAVAPNSADAHVFLGSVYFHVGLIEEALREFERSKELNPGVSFAGYNVGQMKSLLGRYDEAVAEMQENVTVFVRSIIEANIAMALLRSGRGAEARERVGQAKAEFKDVGGILDAMEGLFCALDGDRAGAEERIKEAIFLGEGFGHFHHTTHLIADAYALLEQPDPALQWLEYTVENGYPNYPCIEGDPYLGKLRQNHRFIRLMERLRLRDEKFRKLAHRDTLAALDDARVPAMRSSDDGTPDRLPPEERRAFKLSL